MKNVLVTGANGFIGKTLVKALLERGCHVVALDIRFDEVLAQLKEDGCGQALLVPFMLVAGDHALNDMAGDGPKSWKSRLEAAGVGVRCRMRGLGALPEVQALYGARLREIV